MSHRIYLTALASDDELDLFLDCSVVDPRIADVYRPVRAISLLSVSARSEQSAQQIFAAARNAIDVVLGARQSLIPDWVSWTHTVPPVNDNFAACSVALDGLDVVLPIGAWQPSQLICFCNTPCLVLCEWKHLADICCVLRELRVSHNELPGVAKLIGVCTEVVS